MEGLDQKLFGEPVGSGATTPGHAEATGPLKTAVVAAVCLGPATHPPFHYGLWQREVEAAWRTALYVVAVAPCAVAEQSTPCDVVPRPSAPSNRYRRSRSEVPHVWPH